MVTIFKDESVILYVSVYIPCDIFATTIIRIRISCVGRNSDVHFFHVLIYSYFFITTVFLIFLSNAVTKFPVYGTIKLYCIVLYCIVLYCIGTHALTGCDFTSCFFRKGKLKPFQRLVADISDWHVTALRSLTSIEVDMPGVTSFVCSMYGFTTSDINEAKYKAFIRMSGGDEKYPLATIKKSNCASLPPCNKTLGNHVKRAQVVSMNLEESQSDGSN